MDRFVERFSAVLVDGGMPRMPARAFAVLLASDAGKMTAAGADSYRAALEKSKAGAVHLTPASAPPRAPRVPRQGRT